MIARACTATAALALMAGAAPADVTLTILHTNDVHARFEPVGSSGSSCTAEDDSAGECFGGTARLATALAAARARADTSVLLDGGDQFQGTLFYTQYRGQLAAEMMNRLGYDAMAVGNHEFDDGPDVLADFAAALEAPLLMANADMSGAPRLAEAIEPSTILEAGGERIGVIGLTPRDNAELASPGPDLTFSDPVAATRAEVERLTGEGVDKIVVLSHSGFGVDRRLAEAVEGIDVIVGGHTHTLLGEMEGAEGTYPTMVGQTAIVQAGSYGMYLGELRVTFDDAGAVIAAEGQPILLDASVEADPEIAARIAEAAEPLNEIRARVVAETAAAIDGSREACRAGECEMGVLVAEAMLDRVRDQGIDVALTNGGGLRASIDAGPVTMGEVLTVLPFQNTLSTFRVSGATLRAALENGVSQIEEGGGRFPQVAGMTFAVDAAAAPGARVSDVRIGGAPLDPDALYGVVSNDYLRNGGDGYAMFVDAEDAYDYGPDLADVTAEYLIRTGPYTPRTDGRITVTGR